MSDPVLDLAWIQRVFEQGGKRLEILKGVDLTIQPGNIHALVGPSGTGKSTLLHICGLLERPSSGSVTIKGDNCNRLSDAKRTMIRRERIGFVYQSHHLLADFTALENVVIPQLLRGRSQTSAANRARELLARLGLAERFDHRPARLSGGEQQRVAIARGLANEPALLLGDEPTGNLDPQTAETVFALLLEVVREQGSSALIATHNPDLAKRMDAIHHMRDGKLWTDAAA